MGTAAARDAAPTASAPAASTRQSHRVMTLSADMGGGHNATAAALEQAVLALWPGSEVRRLDTLDVLGSGVGGLFRAIYVANVERTPWLYELFYSSLWRHRWFARSSKRLTGSWCGRRLVDQIDRFDPDLVLSTYPLGSAGLEWLRLHRGLDVPTAAYVSDFAPHPFWVYAGVDVNFVMHEAALAPARAAEARARVAVCAPPVAARFAPGDRSLARRGLALDPDALVVLLSCGAYAFGDLVGLVSSLLESSPSIQIVAACGRNEDALRQLEGLGAPPARLRALAWTEQMADYVRASDLVVSNAGGATALEAVRCGRALVMCRPIAAHGTANADLMVVAGLADLCATESELISYLRAAVADRSVLNGLERHAVDHVSTHDVATGLSALTRPRPRRPARNRHWPMRAEDAFFAHVERPTLRQETGTVLELADVAPGRPVTLAEVREHMAARTPGLPPMRRQLVRGPRPGWILHDTVDVTEHIGEHLIDPMVPGQSLEAAVDAVWSEPMPADRPAWQMTLIRDDRAGRTVLAIKLHHCQGDGISALGLLDRLLDHDPQDPLIERGRSGQPSRLRQDHPGAGHWSSAVRAAGGARQVATGLWSLARRGAAPSLPQLNQVVNGPARQFVTVPLPADELRGLARALRVRPHELTLALVAAALGRLLPAAGLARPEDRLRAMLPIAMRPPVLDRIFGNWTGSVPLDLPLAAMSTADRVAAVSSEIRSRVRRGEPHAGHLVMRVAGRLPAPVHARLARAAYNRRFFNTIVTYLPGFRGDRWCAGARVLAAYPVVPLTERVPLTVGVLVSGQAAGVGVMLDPALRLGREEITAAVLAAFAEAQDPGP